MENISSLFTGIGKTGIDPRVVKNCKLSLLRSLFLTFSAVFSTEVWPRLGPFFVNHFCYTKSLV